MAEQSEQSGINEVLRKQAEYDKADLSKVTLEQAIRLLKLHKMHKVRATMMEMGREMKLRSAEVRYLQRTMQLINKLTAKKGDDRGKLLLPSFEDDSPQLRFAHDLTKLLRSQIQRRPGRSEPLLDLSEVRSVSLYALLQQARDEYGMSYEVKERYEGEEVQNLLEAVRNVGGVENPEAWTDRQDRYELRQLLFAARDQHGLELDIREEYETEDRENLLRAFEMKVKDLNFQNDLQMQDLQRKYQEELEVFQVSRMLMKGLHEDKLHKARSSSGR